MSGSTLFFPVTDQRGQTGEIDAVDLSGQPHKVANGLTGFYWPVMAPDGTSIIYNSPDRSVPDCGGLPHLWRLYLATGRTSQVSTAVSSAPAFVAPNVVWSNEEKLVGCGPGGPAAQDGVILAHDLTTGSDTPVDLSFYLALTSSQAPQWVTTAWLLDAKF